MKGEHTGATTVNRWIQGVQLSVGDAIVGLDGRACISTLDSICLCTSATTTTAEAENLADTQIWQKTLCTFDINDEVQNILVQPLLIAGFSACS
jgi:hypothetical protein